MRHSIFTLITLCISLCISDNAFSQKPITIEQLYKEYLCLFYSPNNITPSADGEHFTIIAGDTKIVEYSFKTGKETSTLLDLNSLEDCPIKTINGYIVSPLGTHILIYSDIQMVYRHSFKTKYYVYDIRYKSIEPLSDKSYEQNAIFSPNGAMIAYVNDNNIYIKKLRYNSTSAITTDGKEGSVINGIADWVYEEEFQTTEAMKWSTDSKDLAYIRFEENNVPYNTLTLYNSNITSSDIISNSPTTKSYKYPHAGEPNSKVSVNVFNIENRTTKTMQTGNEDNYYLPRIEWTGVEKELAIFKLNRRQNQLDILIGNSASTVCNAIFTDREDQYVEVDAINNCIFLPDGKHFLYTGELNGYRHIYLYGKNGVQITQITKGDYDVTKLLGYDATTKRVFFQAAKESPLEREIYSFSIDKKILTKLSSRKGTNDAVFNDSYSYYINTYSSIDTPPVYTICNSSGQTLRTIIDNTQLKETVNQHDFYKKEFFSLNTTDGTPLNGWIVRPKNWNNGEKYPLLLVQYNGPNHQEVLNSWDIDWEQTLAAEGYVVACVDTRGTGARGEAFRKCTYQRLGKQESNDMIDVAKWFGTQSYIDANRIGLWGWSYGGFMTTLCMCKSDIFKMGISVAGVSNWKYYDTAYSERYMRTPEENISGYTSENPLDLAQHLNGRLFLIHGLADDNVLIQNHYDLVTKLIEHNKQFDTFVYPNKNHSIYGGNTRYHLYTMMLNYIKRNL